MMEGVAIPEATVSTRARRDTISAGSTIKKSKSERVAQAPTPMAFNFGSLPLEDRFEWAGKNVMIERPVKGGSGDYAPVLETPSCPVAAAASAALAALLAVYSHNNWMPDDETDCCLKCQKEFTMTFRRHHCRNCGLIFCALCTPQAITLPDKGYRESVRVCEACFKVVSEYLQVKYSED